jgi:hypothetical protein
MTHFSLGVPPEGTVDTRQRHDDQAACAITLDSSAKFARSPLPGGIRFRDDSCVKRMTCARTFSKELERE